MICDLVASMAKLNAAQKQGADVAAAALEAFWATVAQSYPEIETGDLAPDLVVALRDSAEKAVNSWIEWNLPMFVEDQNVVVQPGL